MPASWFRRSFFRLALIAGGLTLALSGCHLHHGHLGGGFGYYSGGHHGGGHYRGHHKKRYGHHRRHRQGGWRGRH